MVFGFLIIRIGVLYAAPAIEPYPVLQILQNKQRFFYIPAPPHPVVTDSAG